MIELDFYDFSVQETDLDLYGHVNNATYLRFLEQARWSLIRNKGFSAKEITHSGIGPILLEIHIQYKMELSSGLNIRILSYLMEHNKKIGKIKHIMTSKEIPDKIYAEALITFALFDLKTRKIIEPTLDWKACLQIDKILIKDGQ